MVIVEIKLVSIFLPSTPRTGIGDGGHFNKYYREAWAELGMYNEKNPHPPITIGHLHSDALLLLALHGLIFVWKKVATVKNDVFQSCSISSLGRLV